MLTLPQLMSRLLLGVMLVLLAGYVAFAFLYPFMAAGVR